jgi:membrane protease YdiL (CAAX protease family)
MNKLKRITWPQLVLLFGVPTLLNFLACRVAIPYIDGLNILPIEVVYFICVGILVLLPMFAGSLYLSGKEIGSYRLKEILARMRVKGLSQIDALWTVVTFIFLVLTSYLVAKVLMPKFAMDATPFFFQNMPLSDEYHWVLYPWIIFFFFNIFGEEFLWRGYIQPRQELLTGKWTWLVHGLFWAGWHIPMGIDLIIAASPIFFILPAIVQYRKNTTIAIIVHTIFGAFGFLALALGAVH